MSREKKLVKNTLMLTIGSIGTKFVTVLLVPLYTMKLATEEYGIVDLLNTFIILLLPIITLQLSNALFRFAIDAKTKGEKKKLYSSSISIIILNTFMFLLVYSIINRFTDIKYASYLAIAVIVNVFSEFHLQFARGLGKMGLYSLTSFVTGVVSIGCNLLLILVFDFGARSILVASIVANTIGIIFLFISLKCYDLIKSSSISKKLIKEMLRYSIPLIPNYLSWWVTNVSDRIIVVMFLGLPANGILAITHKVTNIYIAMFNIFNLSWIESVSRAIVEQDGDVYVNNVFQKVFKLLGMCILGIMAGIPIIFPFYIGEAYASSYGLILIFCVSMFINSLCSLYGGVFIAYKKSNIVGKTTVAGAIANLIVHITLIKILGLYAAAIASIVSYSLILAMRMKRLKKIHVMTLPKAFSARLVIGGSIVCVSYVYNNVVTNIITFVAIAIWAVIENRSVLKAMYMEVKKHLVLVRRKTKHEQNF